VRLTAIVLLLALAGQGLGQEVSRQRVLGEEFGGAFLGELAAVGVIAAAYYYGLFSLEYTTYARAGIVMLGTSASCAAGTGLVGSARNQRGRFLPALAGALVGLPIGAGIAYAGSLTCDAGFGLSLAVASLVAPLGAVVGYNLSRQTAEPDSRLLLPESRLSRERLPDGTHAPVVSACLIRLKV
jgi:hypothetical protein